MRKWQPTPVFLPGELHGQRSLAGYSLWGHKESDTTKRLTHTHTHTANRWGENGNKTGFIFLGSKTTVDGDYSPEIKRHLFLGRIAMTNLGRVLKSRDITLPTKVHILKATVFPIGIYGCDSWDHKEG